jgi:hypothetical protein
VGANWQPHPSENFGAHWYVDPDDGQIKSHNMYELLKQPEYLGKDLFQHGPIQRYSVSARGGSGLFRYYAGVSRDDIEGFSGIDNSESWNTQASITVVPMETLNFTVNASRLAGSTRYVGGLMCTLDCFANPVQHRRPAGSGRGGRYLHRAVDGHVGYQVSGIDRRGARKRRTSP